MSREDGEYLYIKSQQKGTCTTWGRYRHKSKDFWQREITNVPKCYCCDKPIHVKKDGRKIINELKSRNNKNEDNKNKCNDCNMNDKKEKDW